MNEKSAQKNSFRHPRDIDCKQDLNESELVFHDAK